MSKYLITFITTSTKALVEYNAEGCLIEYKLEGGFDEKQFKFFFERFPFTYKRLEIWKTSDPTKFKVEEVEPDLSFSHFWDEFAHKTGNKGRAIKLWDKMNEVNRIAALNHIPIYDQELLKKPGQLKLYPETYLNQRRWDL